MAVGQSPAGCSLIPCWQLLTTMADDYHYFLTKTTRSGSESQGAFDHDSLFIWIFPGLLPPGVVDP